MEIFAAITPGLEGALAEELAALAGRPARQVPGGACLEGSLEDAAGLVLWARTPAHLRVRLGAVPARSTQQLAAGLRALDWSQVLHPGQRVTVRATLRGARFRADAAEAQVRRAAEAATRGRRLSHRRPPPPQAVHLRVVDGLATVSLDAADGPLHKRGYRRATAGAPIRENLAAALLLAAGWVPGAPLADPMCGAGTFSIEAAWMSRDRAPGLDHRPPVCRWPGFPDGAWRALLAEARRAEGVPAPIYTADRNPGAVRATRENARRAGVLGDLALERADLTRPAGPLPGPKGLVIVNPPYGARIADRRRLHGLYRVLGRGLAARFPGWRLAALAPEKALAGRLLPRMEELLTFKNGGIPVGFYVGELPGGAQ